MHWIKNVSKTNVSKTNVSKHNHAHKDGDRRGFIDTVSGRYLRRHCFQENETNSILLDSITTMSPDPIWTVVSSRNDESTRRKEGRGEKERKWKATEGERSEREKERSERERERKR